MLTPRTPTGAWGRVPRRWSYPIGGAVGGLLTLAAFAVLRCASSGLPFTVEAIRIELTSQALAYAFLGSWMCVTLATLGRVVAREAEMLLEESMTDPCTGLANRRVLHWAMGQTLASSRRHRTPLTLLLIDLDGLKKINDTWGHAAGDLALRTVAESIGATCRAADVPARWGGDEFAVLARDTTAAGGLELADRMRATLRRLLQTEAKESLPSVTISIGVVDIERAGSRPEALFFAADRALYQAKANGGDRAELAPVDASAAARLATTAPARLARSTSPGIRRVVRSRLGQSATAPAPARDETPRDATMIDERKVVHVVRF